MEIFEDLVEYIQIFKIYIRNLDPIDRQMYENIKYITMTLIVLFIKGRRERKILNNNAAYQISKIISRNDRKLLKKVKEHILGTMLYFKKHKKKLHVKSYEEYYPVENQIDQIMEFLQDNDYCWSVDWKIELQEVIPIIDGFKYSLDYMHYGFDESAYLPYWCEKIDREWKSSGMCIGNLDIDGDCYIIFPCKIEDIERLNEIVKETNYKILFAKDCK